MINPGQYGEMFDVLPIFAAALLLGMVGGVALIHFLTTRARWRSIGSMMGVIALAAPLMSPIAARPSSGPWTAGLFLLSGALMAGVDLAATCIVDPIRAVPRYSRRARLLIWVWGTPGMATAVCMTLACLRVWYDIPLNPELQPSFAVSLFEVLAGLLGVDLALRAAIVGLSRLWRRFATSTTTAYNRRMTAPFLPKE